MCYQLGSGTREATPRGGWHIHVRPGVLSTFPAYFTSLTIMQMGVLHHAMV